MEYTFVVLSFDAKDIKENNPKYVTFKIYIYTSIKTGSNILHPTREYPNCPRYLPVYSDCFCYFSDCLPLDRLNGFGNLRLCIKKINLSALSLLLTAAVVIGNESESLVHPSHYNLLGFYFLCIYLVSL